MKKFFSIIFVILLSAPVALWLAGRVGGNGDNTVVRGFPRPEAPLWLDRAYYQAVEGWFIEALPAGNPLKVFHNWLDYQLFSTTSDAGVHIGIHGWLFTGQATPAPGGPAVDRQTGHRLFLDCHAVEKIIAAAGRRFLFTVIPGKAAIYPEFLGSGMPRTGSPVYQALLKANARHPLTGFIGLEPALKKAKLNGIDVYHRQSLRWSCEGAAAAAEQILAVQEPGRLSTGSRPAPACPPPDHDLYRRLLGDEPHETISMAGHAAGPHAVTGPTAVIYGDDYLNRLLPFITHAFNAISVIDSAREPTFGRNVMTATADLIVLESGEDRLGRIHLNLESLYAAADTELHGVVKRDIALTAATPVTRCALDVTPGGLQIRSSGESSFFALPPVAGSTKSVFRMAKLTFSAAHQGPIIVRTRPDAAGLIRRVMNRETRYLIVPLPFADSVGIQINPSEHPGVFTLESAEVLSFYGEDPPPVTPVTEPSPTDGDIYSGMDILPVEPPPAVPVFEPAELKSESSADERPDLTLTDIEPGRIFQRQGRGADIVVTGTYTGASGPVEARVVADGSDAVAVPWTVVDGSPENGLFTGILHQVPQGGWYRLQVRSGIAPETVEAGQNRWGVGILVGCIGQSNMREWFYTGNDHQPSPLLRVFRDGRWVQPGTAGNGALAMGNRLTAALKIPVGLLDYSVNGTGLTAKAEWGRGFWLDTGPEGIYRRLVNGVNATGGSIEYVVWMQGEADAARGTVSREEYRAALERLVNDRIRSDIKNGSSRPQLPFLMIPLVKRPTGKDTTCQWIRDAQMDALESIDECHLAAQSIDLENRGRQHLAPASYTTLGLRTAQTILFLLGKGSFHRGPSVANVTIAAERFIDIAIRHRGGTDFTPWSAVSGFEVWSGGQPLPVASVSRKDGSTIRIELEGSVPTDISVRYLYGAHPDTSNPVRDNTDLRLPLDPFVQQGDQRFQE